MTKSILLVYDELDIFFIRMNILKYN